MSLVSSHFMRCLRKIYQVETYIALIQYHINEKCNIIHKCLDDRGGRSDIIPHVKLNQNQIFIKICYLCPSRWAWEYN